MLKKNTTVGGAGFTYVDLNRVAGEIVETYEPENVTDLQYSEISVTSNGCILSWSASASPDIKDYRIYLGSTLIGTVTTTTFSATGLTVAANNLLVVKSRNTANYESYGTKITVKTNGAYAYQVSNGGDYVKFPTLSFDAVEIICKPNKAVSGYYFDGRDGTKALFSKDSVGNDEISTPNDINKLIVDGVTKVTGGYGIGSFVPINLKQIIRLEMFQPISDDANIFSDKNGGQNMTGLIYSVKAYKLGNLIAHYDLTESFTGIVVTDKSGNNNNGTLGRNANNFVIG